MAMTSVIGFLGTGSGIPSANRYFSSTLLHLCGLHLLLDAGEPCVHLLRERGDLLIEIDAVLVTHGHVDHIGGIPALLQGCKLLGRTSPLDIYLPAEMIAPLRAWISALYLIEEDFGFAVSWNAWIDGTPVTLHKESDGKTAITVTPHRNGHLDACYRGSPGADPKRNCDSYSIEILVGEGRMIFSGDLASPRELQALVQEPTLLLVSELSHFSPDQLAEALQGKSVQTLCLTHLAEDFAEDRSDLQVRMEELLPMVKDVIIPEDGEVLDF